MTCARQSPGLLLVLVLLLPPALTDAQEPDTARVEQAIELRNAGDFARAAALLRAHVRQEPGDAHAAELLGETLYWMKDPAAARTVYESALARHPASTSLRLRYGQMLLETGDFTRLKQVVAPLVGRGRSNGRAEALLGTAAYWGGDLSTARRFFRASLAEHPSQPEVRRQLAEIAAVTAPWASLAGAYRNDDQPLHSGGAVLELGWFASPATAIIGHAGSGFAGWGDSVRVPVANAMITLKHGVPALRLQTEFSGGVSAVDGSAEPVGKAGLSVRTAPHLSLNVAAERERYLYTAASLRARLLTDAVSAGLALEHPRGWLGEVAHLRQYFPDANVVHSSHGWLLAPILRRAPGTVQVGYALSYQNAAESRYDSATSLYAPYYTPGNVVTHSVLGAVSVAPTDALFLRLDGAFGGRATDDDPAPGAQPGLPFFPGRPGGAARRTFTPWRLRAEIGVPLAAPLTLRLHAEAVNSPFYTAAEAGLRVTYRRSRVAE